MAHQQDVKLVALLFGPAVAVGMVELVLADDLPVRLAAGVLHHVLRQRANRYSINYAFRWLMHSVCSSLAINVLSVRHDNEPCLKLTSRMSFKARH